MNYQTQQLVKTYGKMGMIAIGYGNNIKDYWIEKESDGVVQRLGDQNICIKLVEFSYEDYETREYQYRYTVREILSKIVEEYDYKVGDISTIKTVGHLHEMYEYTLDDSTQLVYFLREEDAIKEENENRRIKLERYAKDFAKECGYNIGTFEFINKLEERLGRVRGEREDFNSGEAKRERWMDYSYAGCRDSYWTDNDFENGRYGARETHLEDILDWLHEECPLLMAKYKEHQLEEENEPVPNGNS